MISCYESWNSIARLAAHAGPSTLRSRLTSLCPPINRQCAPLTSAARYSTNPVVEQQDPVEASDQETDAFFVELDEGEEIDTPVPDVQSVDDAADSGRRPIGEYRASGRSWDLDPPEAFDDVVKELLRRKKKAESKRMQRVSLCRTLTMLTLSGGFLGSSDGPGSWG